jgi:serine/threonine-protein kinase
VSLGTPQYMSPEQAMGERSTDARTDLFALGAVTYEMLTGEPPFAGPTVQAIVSKVLTSQPVPVDELRRNVPEHAAAAIMAALEKLPADRPASAEQFAQMLAGSTPAPVGRTSGARPKAAAPRSLTQRLLPWIAGLAAGVALGAGVVKWRGTEPGSSTGTDVGGPLRFLFVPGDSLQIQAVCCGRMFALSPDGRTLVYQARVAIVDTTKSAPPVRLYRREVGSLTPVALEGTENAQALSISPDGTQLAFTSGTKLMRMPLRGGPVTTVATLPTGYIGGTDWRDNEHLLVSVQYLLYSVSTKDGRLDTLVAPARYLQQITGPAAVAGTGAALFTYVARDEAPRVQFLAAGAKSPKALMFGATPHYVPAWKALVINRQGRLLAYPFDPASGDTLGAGVPFAEGVALRSPVLSHGEFDIAPTGTYVLTQRQEGTIVGWSPNSRVALRENGTSKALPLPMNDLIVYDLDFSPTGKRLVMTTRNFEHDGLVFTYDFERGTYQRVSSDEETYTSTFNDSGDSVIYVERHANTLKIRAADGTGTATVFAKLNGWAQVEQLSVRGDWAVFSGRATASTASLDIGKVRRGQTTPVVPVADSPSDEGFPRVSPDGRWIAYEMTQTGQTDVYVSPFPETTSRTIVSKAGGRQPVWSGDGRTLSYVTADGAFVSVAFTAGVGGAPPTFGPPRELYRRAFARFWTLSPDGTRLLTIDTSALLTLLGLEVVVGFRPAF